jgi:pyruvate dehydrogenase E2 component (dihydrolipoamide acetyltransferase)
VARELGVDLAEVEGSGADGRVLLEDVRAAAERGREGAPPERAKHREARREREAPALPDFSRWGEVERKPLRSVRRTTARRMARSWEQIPHVTHNDLADVTELEAFRRRHAEEIERRGGGKLTLTVLVMKAVVAALSDHPRFNASLDPEKEELIYKRYYHLGVALDSERGLLVPTIRDVDRKSLGELARELSELAERARAGKVSREDMAGSTFTISNVGPMGGTHFTPIINYPEVAILGLARARLQNVVRGTLEDPEVVTRFLLPLSLGFDHRVNDGADAARFLNRVIEVLSDVESFALAV